MGLFDKLFKKKKKKGEAKAPEAAPAVKEEPLPTEPVPRAFALARKANKDFVAAGKYNEKRSGIFAAQLDELEASDASDDAKLIGISQIRGGMLLASMATATTQ